MRNNNGELKKRILLDLFTYPLTLGLLLAGLTLLFAAWAMERNAGSVLLGAIASLAGSVSVFLTRFFVFGQEIANREAAQMQEEANAERERQFSELERTLAGDGGANGATMLRDLRALLKAFQMSRAQQDAVSPISVDVAIGIEQLFERCVRSLEQAHQLWLMSQAVATTQARVPILREREKLMKEVQESIGLFAKTLSEMQRLVIDERCASELAQIRSQLDRNLESAKQIHEQMMLEDHELTTMNGTQDVESRPRAEVKRRVTP
jgi:hypothetical protein